jgi:hypothetical protein
MMSSWFAKGLHFSHIREIIQVNSNLSASSFFSGGLDVSLPKASITFSDTNGCDGKRRVFAVAGRRFAPETPDPHARAPPGPSVRIH